MLILKVRSLGWKTLLLNIVAVSIPLFFIVYFGNSISSTTNQTYFVITSLSILGILNYLIVKNGSKPTEIKITNDSIHITNNNNKDIIHCSFDEISEYNIYRFINNRAGYIVRLKTDKFHYHSLLTWESFDKSTSKEISNFQELQSILNSKLSVKKKTSKIDLIYKFLSVSPYIILGLSLILLISLFIYIFNT
ncbi:hypothetical protein [Moheibacter stercoris]|uniref:PH domain-containing protein n=1 Tax=Moheibacter stercoris TaxID=1628251 RepID=A0ABV2LUH3_9FLAO